MHFYINYKIDVLPYIPFEIDEFEERDITFKGLQLLIDKKRIVFKTLELLWEDDWSNLSQGIYDDEDNYI